MRTIAPAAALALLVGAVVTPRSATGNSFGIAGQSRTGCGSAGNCHGANPGATADLTGPMVLAPGSTGTYTLAVHSTLAGFTRGGVDVSAVGATLAANAMEPDTTVLHGDLVHTMPIARGSDGILRVRFDVHAPSTPGAVTLYAAGAATTGHGMDNTAWALATLGVTVSSNTVPADGGAGTDAGGAGAIQYDPTYSMGYSGCAVSTGGGGSTGGSTRRTGAGVGLAFVTLALARVRRRAR